MFYNWFGVKLRADSTESVVAMDLPLIATSAGIGQLAHYRFANNCFQLLTPLLVIKLRVGVIHFVL